VIFFPLKHCGTNLKACKLKTPIITHVPHLFDIAMLMEMGMSTLYTTKQFGGGVGVFKDGHMSN
jgi:hypothetical protein